VRWCADGDSLHHFCVLYFQRAACSKFQTCILNSHWGHTMCGSMVDIQFAAAEIRRGIKKEGRKKPQGKNIMSASATQGVHNNNDNVYGAVIMTIAIAKVHPVHLTVAVVNRDKQLPAASHTAVSHATTRPLQHTAACCGENSATCRTAPQWNASGVNEPQLEKEKLKLICKF